MSRPGFYDENRGRAFPFLHGTAGVRGGAGLRGLGNDAVVDCGFVMGVDSGFASGTHDVYLQQVTRAGDTFTLSFATDALPGATLEFTRTLDEDDYTTEHAASAATHASSWSDEDCDEPLWSGYLVTGQLAALVALLPSDGTAVRAGDAVTVEPALVHNLAGAYIKMFACANQDRTRISSPDGCPEVVWPFETGGVIVNSRCIQGEVLLKPGFNCTLRQENNTNALTVGASVGAGAGEPCDEVSLFDDESFPDGESTLGGGPGCREVLRSVNGKGGRLLNVIAGYGVVVTPDPGSSTVVVNVHLAGLAACDDSVVSVSE